MKPSVDNMTTPNDIQLIIPMSGIGRRFLEAGYTDPKPLIEIDGKPIIEHVVNMFPGVTDIIFICNDEHLRTTNMIDVLYKIAPQSRIISIPIHSHGPVHAIYQAKDRIDLNKETIVSYCDYGTNWKFDGFLKKITHEDFDGVIGVYKGFHPHMLGSDNYAFCREDSGCLLEIQEKKPFTNNKMDEYASNGMYYFKSGSLLMKYADEILNTPDARVNGECYVSVLYNSLVRDSLKVGLFEIDHMLQWGTPYDLEVYKNWSKYFADIIHKQEIIPHEDNVTLVLPLAGEGSRFTQCGYTVPKPYMDINGSPMVIQAVRCLPPCSKNVFIGRLEHQVAGFENILRDEYHESKIITIDGVTQGQACSCELALIHIEPDEPILISACDNGVCYDHQAYNDLVNDPINDVIVWSFRNNPTSKINPDMYSWLDVEDGLVRSVSCKKFNGIDPLTTHAIIGTMFFRKSDYFRRGLEINYQTGQRTNNEYYVDDVVQRCIEMGLRVRVFEVDNYICWGTPDDYKTYQYWRQFFHECEWHPYSIEKDITSQVKP
jgi:NDP-sugar pyrophosphorylase family protein